MRKHTLTYILFTLFALQAVSLPAYANGLSDSTTTKKNVVGGESPGGSGGRILAGDLKSVYDGAETIEGNYIYRVRWPYLNLYLRANNQHFGQYNISSGSATTTFGQYVVLSPSGLLIHSKNPITSLGQSVTYGMRNSPWTK